VCRTPPVADGGLGGADGGVVLKLFVEKLLGRHLTPRGGVESVEWCPAQWLGCRGLIEEWAVAVSVDVETSGWGRLWLTVESLDDGDATVIRVRGGIAADRAEELWEAIEGALERAVGARVVVDLSEVTGFDVGSIEELASAAMAAVRRHADLCAVVKPHSAFDHYVRCCGLVYKLPLYD
jgi:anti-anti-sigma regulatory factor